VDTKERRREVALAIGARIKVLRDQAGLSQEKLAQRMDMSRETVRAVEAGKTLPEIPTLEAFAAALGVGLADLLEWGGATRVKLRGKALVPQAA
jgi:transcriptional regulator with XRE-family HTH domain